MLSPGIAELCRFGFHGAWERETITEKNHKAQATNYLVSVHSTKNKKKKKLGFFSLLKSEKGNYSGEGFLNALKAWIKSHKNKKYCQNMI